ncbi:MAG TPA: chemotaxis protein [Stellaceae bacterium]|nr:chemotaxis protein [Stellaceae bacterium]
MDVATKDGSDITMRARKDLDKIAGAIRAASTSTEARFVDIGGRLENSVETVTTLTRTFDTLSSELRGETLRQATHDLSQIATRVSALAQAQSGEVSSFRQLTELTSAIEHRVAHMGKSVKGVAMLATNAKIAAAHIGDSSVDFISFATEINRTLRLAQASLDQFAAELAGVGRHLRTAIASQSALDEHHSASVRAIPLRLGRSVDAIAARGKRAVATASAVGQGSHRIGKRIGDAVMALQIGDITRQRIEHVDYALGLLDEFLPPLSVAQDAGHAGQEALIGFCCRLQAAQLTDMADQFDHEVQQILKSLQELAADAREIPRLGSDTFGASGERRGTFLGELEEEVSDIGTLLTGFRSARRDADQAAASVSEATTRLVSHISTVRSLEADIRLMGLNTTLKCGRLGDVGRPLGIIAQELRLYANEIATEAIDVMTDLDQVVAISGALSGRDQDGRAADIASVADIMAHSLSGLSAVGQSLADALGTLEHDGDVVAGLLQETVARTNVHHEIGQVLRQAAADLTSVAPKPDYDLANAPEADRLVELIARSYTMERERKILNRHAPGRSHRNAAAAPPPRGPAPAPAELEDIFF